MSKSEGQEELEVPQHPHVKGQLVAEEVTAGKKPQSDLPSFISPPDKHATSGNPETFRLLRAATNDGATISLSISGNGTSAVCELCGDAASREQLCACSHGHAVCQLCLRQFVLWTHGLQVLIDIASHILPLSRILGSASPCPCLVSRATKSAVF